MMIDNRFLLSRGCRIFNVGQAKVYEDHDLID